MRGKLECDAVFEDGNLAVAVLLVAGLFARGDGKNLVDEFGNDLELELVTPSPSAQRNCIECTLTNRASPCV